MNALNASFPVVFLLLPPFLYSLPLPLRPPRTSRCIQRAQRRLCSSGSTIASFPVLSLTLLLFLYCFPLPPSFLQDQQVQAESAEEFVQRWISSPSSDVCGHWQFQYAETHKDIRSGAGPKKHTITFQVRVRAQQVLHVQYRHLPGAVCTVSTVHAVLSQTGGRMWCSQR